MDYQIYFIRLCVNFKCHLSNDTMRDKQEVQLFFLKENQMDQYGYPFVINVDLDYMLLQNIKKTIGITRLGLLNISKRGNCNILKIIKFDTFNVFITFSTKLLQTNIIRYIYLNIRHFVLTINYHTTTIYLRWVEPFIYFLSQSVVSSFIFSQYPIITTLHTLSVCFAHNGYELL